MLLLGAVSVSAQEIAYDFTPHWYIQGQFGGQHTLGEVSFGNLNSLNAQLGVGYNFTPVVGTRFSVNGWQSKGGSTIDGNEYLWKWNYVAPSLDLTVNLSNWFGGYKYDRLCTVGVFAGLGANVAFGNNDAHTANNQIKSLHSYAATYQPLAYLWGPRPGEGDKTLLALVGRFGANVDFRITDAISLGLELQANTLSDRYNSKRAGNTDWYFNALAGIKINLGDTYTTRVIAVPAPVTNAGDVVPEPKVVEKPVEVVKYVREPLRRDIFFKINSTVISEAEGVKVQDVVDYLKKYPEAKVSLSGYADAGTGNDKINDRLAAQRAEKVMNVLVQKGISVDRISYESHGSRVQPFQENDKNRVTICIAE